MKSILIIGAKSDIAKEVALVFAKNGYRLILAGRDIKSLNSFAKHITITTSQEVILKEFDIVNFSSHEGFYKDLNETPTGTVIVSGYMEEQKTCEDNWAKTLNTINVNYTGAVSILNIIANHLEEKESGFIIGVSSVAGDRGRASNYIYGSAKAGFTAYLSGLRNRLASKNVHILTVKPGFVYTQMTKNLDLPAKLTAQPKDVAKDIYNAIEKKRNVLYTKSIWFVIMLIIKLIPESIFKKLHI